MGVVKQLIGLWLDSIYSEIDRYFGLDEVQRWNAKLAIVIPLSNIKRLTLDLNQRPNMKSSEWRKTLLCYSPFFFKVYYQHLCGSVEQYINFFWDWNISFRYIRSSNKAHMDLKICTLMCCYMLLIAYGTWLFGVTRHIHLRIFMASHYKYPMELKK